MAYPPLKIEFQFRTQRFKDAEVGLRALADDFDKAWDGMPAILGAEMRTFLDSVAEFLAQQHSNAWPGGTTPTTLSSRSGGLIEGIKASVTITGTTFDDLQGGIGGPFYARVQEYGATIKVKRAKWLTIPLPAALDSKGVPLKKKARDWKNTFIARSKKGNLLIFKKEGGRKIVPLYALKKEVTIPPRLGMKKAIDGGLPYFVDRAVDRMLKGLFAKETVNA